jgi:CheY-like chemotaxis protein
VTYPLRVLLVDDDDAIAFLLEVNFATDARFELAGRASEGAEGVALARTLRPDVIVMDIQMPVLDGIAATARIVEADPNACIVCLTASSNPRDHDAALTAGATAILAKPFEPQQLVDAVAQHALKCAESVA